MKYSTLSEGLALAGKHYSFRASSTLANLDPRLIAIMLGRLEMDVDECIEAYTKLAEAVFSQKKSRLPFGLKGKVKAQFDSSKLEKAIRETIKGSGISDTALFNDGNERGCRT